MKQLTKLLLQSEYSLMHFGLGVWCYVLFSLSFYSLLAMGSFFGFYLRDPGPVIGLRFCLPSIPYWVDIRTS